MNIKKSDVRKPPKLDGFTGRCYWEDKKAWLAAAKQKKLSLTQFIIEACNQAVEKHHSE